MNAIPYRVAGLTAILLLLSSVGAIAEYNHDLFTQVLRDHVHYGRVNYKAIKSDARFGRYLDRLKRTDPAKLEQRDRLPFWINVYNAYTIKLVIDHYPLKSITDLNRGGMVISHALGTTAWDRDIVAIHGTMYTLNHVEHEIIRKMGEPRIHFALVCAAVSCPPLRSEAYTASQLHQQLDEQARLFLGDRRHNRFDIGNRRVWLSKIFDWYSEDFGGSDERVLEYVARFLPQEQADAIRAGKRTIDIDYLDYDWSLNE